MKKFLMISCLGLGLSGCASVGGLPGLDPKLQADIQQARLLVQQACGIFPDVAAVINMISDNPRYQDYENIVAAICSRAEVKQLKRSKLYNKYKNELGTYK